MFQIFNNILYQRKFDITGVRKPNRPPLSKYAIPAVHSVS